MVKTVINWRWLIMTNRNKEETIDNDTNGIIGKAYLDIDRVLNESDYKTKQAQHQRIEKMNN